MNSLSFETFKETLPGVVSGVLYDGDIVKVDVGDAGAFVVMDEPEYVILIDALRAVIAVAGSVEPDEKTIYVEKLLAKIGG